MRPIKSRSFGDTALPGLQFAITAKLPGEAAGEGYIVEQQGSRKYLVNVNGTIGPVFLVNTLTPANLNDGEAFIAVDIFGGSQVAAFKIMQKRVNVWLTPDSPTSQLRSYVWSQDPATQTGQADVGVSTAGATSNVIGTAEQLIFEQEPAGTPGTKYIDTFRAFGWTSQSTPGFWQHRMFATSNNKIVLIHENDTSGNLDGGAITVLDGTTDPVPTVIGGAKITGSTRATIGQTDEVYENLIQLTDTRYVRLSTNPQTIEIVNTTLTHPVTASVVATFDLNAQFAIQNQGTTSRNRMFFRISDTQFGIVWMDEGITNTATASGSVQMMILQDNGASIGTVMSKTTVIDVTAPANNGGDANATCSDVTTVMLDITNRKFLVGYERSQSTTPYDRDYFVLAVEMGVGWSSITTVGTPTLVLPDATFNGTLSPRLVRVSDTHAAMVDEHRGPAMLRFPHFAKLVEMNPSTLAVTTGTEQVLGPDNGSGESERDFGAIVASDGNLYVWAGWNDDALDESIGTAAVNQNPFDYAFNDNFVDTAANLTTDWAGAANNTRVTAIDTGITHRWNTATWDVPTTNLNTFQRGRGNVIWQLGLNTGTNVITEVKSQYIHQNDIPRYRSDGAGGVEKTYESNESSGNALNIVELPNGKIVIGGYTEVREKAAAPYLTKAAADADAASLRLSGEFTMQYFDPTLMP